MVSDIASVLDSVGTQVPLNNRIFLLWLEFYHTVSLARWITVLVFCLCFDSNDKIRKMLFFHTRIHCYQCHTYIWFVSRFNLKLNSINMAYLFSTWNLFWVPVRCNASLAKLSAAATFSGRFCVVRHFILLFDLWFESWIISSVSLRIPRTPLWKMNQDHQMYPVLAFLKSNLVNNKAQVCYFRNIFLFFSRHHTCPRLVIVKKLNAEI